MVPSRLFRRSVASACVSFLLVLATGLPSHHHESGGGTDPNVGTASVDHHGHASELVESGDQVPAGGPLAALPPGPVLDLADPVQAIPAPAGALLLRPRERSPPPGAPRAPPVRI